MKRTRLAVLSLAALVILGTVIVPAVALAAGNTLSIGPATTTAGGNGSSFTVNVNANGSVPISGVSATVNFDKSRLQVTAITKGPEWVSNGAAFGGFPSAANMASVISGWNGAGKISPAIAPFFTDGSTNLTAGTDHIAFSVTFQVIGCGASSLDLTVGPSDGGMLDGTVGATYGAALAVTSTSGSVVSACPTPTPAPTPTPSATPPPASAPPGAGTANVTGTLDSGFLGITVPTSVVIPLVRNATNTKDVTVTVFSNIVWNLNVQDFKLVHTGHMTDGAKFLSNPLGVTNGVYSVNLETGGLIGTGSNSTNVTTTLSQFVAPVDPPGSYGIQVVYTAVSGF